MAALQSPPAAVRDSRLRLRWWLPLALVGLYAAALIPELPAIVAHTWWSADSGSAGVIAQLYRQPPAGQYIVLGDHGWYEAFSFYLLTRGLPAHRLLWYGFPVVIWVSSIALIAVPAARAFGRYGAALAAAGLLCLARAGLMLAFQPTAHTNVIFHAAVLAAVAGWLLPRIGALTLPVVLGVGVLIGAFTGLALAGDAMALAWAVLPFVVATGVCAWRGPAVAAPRTVGFTMVTLAAMLAVSRLFTAIMHGAGIRVDQLAQTAQLQFVKPDALAANVGRLFNELTYWVGGNFLGYRIDGGGFLELVSGCTLLLGAVAVLRAVQLTASGVARRPSGGSAAAVDARLVYTAFWGTCLAVGLLSFLLASEGPVNYRYLLGPLVAIAALLPLAAARGGGWRIAVCAGLAVMALGGLARVAARQLPYLAGDVPLPARDMTAIERFAHRHHATYGYGLYWDAVMVTWHTNFAVNVHPVTHCLWDKHRYCPLYHADSFTAAYIPRRGLRTLFIADRLLKSKPVAAWGRPLATERLGRLTLYAYPYDIANRFPRTSRWAIRRVISG